MGIIGCQLCLLGEVENTKYYNLNFMRLINKREDNKYRYDSIR
jgi:hypothetical protein